MTRRYRSDARRRYGVAALILALGAAAAGTSLAQPAAEEAQLDLPPGAAFEIANVRAGAAAARDPFLLSFQHARLAPGRALRISVSLDPAAPPDTRLSFRPAAMQGGACRAGVLAPGATAAVFEGNPGAAAGSCELRWTLDGAARLRNAGTFTMTLRWKLESVPVRGEASVKRYRKRHGW